MSGSRLLRLRVNERLEAAVEEIFGLVEKTIAEYEEEAVRSKREIGQLKQQLEQLVVLKPEVILTRADTQPVFEARPPWLQQYEVMTEESPVLEEVNIQERPRVKEETAERRLSPDVEVDAANEAEDEREINRLQPHTELQAGLKAEGTSSTADTQEVCPSQQPVTVEGTKTHGAEQIQEEQEEVPISPDLEADAFNVYEVGDPDSEPDKYCEPLSSDNESMDDDNERTQVDRPSAERQRPRRGNKSCHVCGMNFMRDTSLIKHVARHHKGHKPFRCPQCPKEFNQREHIVSHMWNHTGQKPFRCDFCDKAFLRKDSRLTHMERFHKEKLYCEKCGKYIFNKKHTQFCRGLPEACRAEGLKCSICSKVFKRRHLFVRHASVHDGGKPFGWGFFDDRLTRKSARILQMKEHDGQKPCPCERCGKAFTSSVYLARHTEGCTGTPDINDLAEPHEAGALTQQPVQE